MGRHFRKQSQPETVVMSVKLTVTSRTMLSKLFYKAALENYLSISSVLVAETRRGRVTANATNFLYDRFEKNYYGLKYRYFLADGPENE